MKKCKLIFLLTIFSSLLIGCEKTPETKINDTSSSKSEYDEYWETLLNRWANEDLEKLYFTVLVNKNEDENTEIYMEKAERSFELFKLLEDNADAFVVDAYNYQTNYERLYAPMYMERNLNYPQEIDPDGQCIRLSKNYFKQNPIETSDGSDLTEKIIYDDLTLNVLVPEKYKDMEEQIIEAHRERFYSEKVDTANNYNKEYGIDERLEIPKKNLKINIIYVKDGQKYFTYRSDCAEQTFNYAEDPVVQIYTSNINCSYIYDMMNFNVYFPCDTHNREEAFAKIQPYVKQCNVENVFKEVYCVASLIIE